MEKQFDDIKLLFQEAQQANEFEFILALINYHGISSQDTMSNLHEWFDAIDFYKGLFENLIGKEKARLGLLIYSTFFENSDFYNIIGSLCRIKLGFKGSSYLFWKTKKYERLLGVGEKEDFLIELLDDAGKESIINFFKENHFKEIRNAFFHSAYSLTDEDLIIHDSEPIFIDGVGYPSMNLRGFFYTKLESVLNVYDSFKQSYFSYFASYKTDKEVNAYFPNPVKAIIMGSGKGLKGFRIPNSVNLYGEWHDSGIWYDEQWGMWEAYNIRINFAQVETIEINDQIKRFEAKEKINKCDSELDNLIEKIVERGQISELSRIIAVLIKFGEFGYKKMEETSNQQAKQGYIRNFLPYFQKAIAIAKGKFNMSEIETKISKFN